MLRNQYGKIKICIKIIVKIKNQPIMILILWLMILKNECAFKVYVWQYECWKIPQSSFNSL